MAWGDYDNDGDLDLVVTGAVAPGTGSSILYRNDPHGTLTPDSAVCLTGLWAGSADWADYDGDGDLDLLLTGTVGGGTHRTIFYENDPIGTLAYDGGHGLPGLGRGDAAWGDYDDDGDLDLALTGDGNGWSCARIYSNDGAANFAQVADVLVIAYSSCAWGDYDNDGDLDVAFIGGTWQGWHGRIYENTDAGFAQAFVLPSIGLGSVSWADVDQDGNLDLFVTGAEWYDNYCTRLYRNVGADFVPWQDLPPVNNSDAQWADFDNDGDLDLAISGLPPEGGQLDFDGDGLGDVCDPDDDNDGLLDETEVDTAQGSGCPDPLNPDSDGDTLSDGDEVSLGTAPCDPDTDGDAVHDAYDNCPTIANADQPDSDADGIGDACDNCPTVANADQPDSDADGIGDACEALCGTDPLDPDTDDDGLLDGTEVEMAQGSACPDPLNPDSDGDTLSDGDEVSVGTAPCDPDTDGDGAPDNWDPDPLNPGAPCDNLEQIIRDLANDISIMDLALFNGPNENANKGRRNALANRATASANIVSNCCAGDPDCSLNGAINTLESLLDKIDGESPPPDWMDESPEKTALAADVSLLIALLEFEL